MAKALIALLIILLIILAILLFWIIFLSASLLLFGRKGREKKLLSEKKEMV